MARPTPQPPDGDTQFLGVNQADPPAVLPPGALADAINNRCRHGRAEPRLGPVKLPWTNLITPGIPLPSTPFPFGTIYGAGTFRDEDDLQWAIIAADGKVFRTREGNGSAELTLPAGVSITRPVEFEQTYNGLIMFRGPDFPELIMVSLDAGFVSVRLEDNVVTGSLSENPNDGTDEIPPADRGSFINGRLFIPYETTTEKDLVAISDYNNATRYAPVRAQGRINQGSSDKLVRILKFGKSNIAVCFKDNSVYELDGLSGALSEMQQDEITKEFGLAAPKAAINVGKDEADAPDEVWFLANRRGIMRITPDASTGRLGVQSIPASRAMNNIVERINWEVVDGATFATWDNKLYAAVPIDDATVSGSNLLGSLTYDDAPSYVLSVIPGATYRWTKGANDFNLVNGAEAISDTSLFTAASSTVTLNGTGAGLEVTAQVQRVWTRCNNAVLVFDFERGQWAGVDTGSAIQVKEWLHLRFAGEERLFFLGEDGFINLYEWLFDDQTAYESLGPNITFGRTLDDAGTDVVPVERGRNYTYVITPSTERLVNGAQEITAGAGILVAQTESIVFHGPPFAIVGTPMHLVQWILTSEDIDHDVSLRGFTHQNMGRKRGLWARFHFLSWYPRLSISEITEGVEEEIMRLKDETKSRTRYTEPHSKPNYDGTNINLDHATPHREDYALVLEENVVASGAIQAGVRYLVESFDVVSDCAIEYNGVTVNNGETFVGVAGVVDYTPVVGGPRVLAPDSYAFFDDPGINPDLHQEWSQDVRLHSHGRARQFRVRNQQGRCELVAVEIYGKDEEQRPGKRT